MAAELRCAIYTRKSTSQGLEKSFNSLDAQREACQAYIQSHALEGWALHPGVFEDGGFTGANTDRPGFKSLLEQVQLGGIQAVVVYKVDRLSRSLVDFAQVMAHFNRHGVAFVSVTQNFSTADPVGRLTLNMLMSFAEFEREMITDRIRDKVEAARRKGKWTGGHAPFGYISHKGHLEVLPDEAEWVNQVFAWHSAGISALGISERLNDAEVPLKTMQRDRTRPWTKDLVLRILRNRLYLGQLHCRGEWVTGEHLALIEEPLFQATQARLKPRDRRTKAIVRNPSYLVRGTLRCGACGYPMTSASTNRDGRVHRYYRCTTRDKGGRKACPTKQLPADAIEAFVVERLRDYLSDPEVCQDIPARFGLDEGDWSFERLWGCLNLMNRQFLVRLLVEEVLVDEAKGALSIRLRAKEGVAC